MYSNVHWISMALQKCIESLTSTQGSHVVFFKSSDVDVASTIPVGGPRKSSQTSRKRDSSASLQLKVCKHYIALLLDDGDDDKIEHHI